MDRANRVLVVDDSELICSQVTKVLARAGYQAAYATRPEQALQQLAERPHALVLVDLRMPGMDGMEFLRRLAAGHPDTAAVVITAHGSVDAAVEAMKIGARDFLSKPFSDDHLLVMVSKVMEEWKVRAEVRDLRRRLRQDQALGLMVSRAPAMERVLEVVRGVAGTDLTVLIEGETGTGKEVLARAVHAASGRAAGPFVPVHCGGLPESLLESELFGHERGAFTGAGQRHTGRFERAHGGTLFLDEIGTMPETMQVKLLRVLEDGQFERVGGTEPLRTDARVVAASNENLHEQVQQGRFRQDLFFRLHVVAVRLPPLRERREDVAALAEYFLQQLLETLPGGPRGFTPEAIDRLLAYDWPGNVRELRNVVERAAVVEQGELVGPDALPEDVRVSGRGTTALELDFDRPLPQLTAQVVEQVEREYLTRLLERHRGNVTRTAQASGLSRRSVGEKVRRYGLGRRRK